MPPELRDQIEAACRKSGRSMNAEIVHRLEDSLVAKEVVPRDSRLELRRIQESLDRQRQAMEGMNLEFARMREISRLLAIEAGHVDAAEFIATGGKRKKK